MIQNDNSMMKLVKFTLFSEYSDFDVERKSIVTKIYYSINIYVF